MGQWRQNDLVVMAMLSQAMVIRLYLAAVA